MIQEHSNKDSQTEAETQTPTQPQTQPQASNQFQPEEFERAINDLGRAFAVYFTWKSSGLLDRSGESQDMK